MSKKLPVNNFEWIEGTSKFNEDFMRNYNEESNEGYFLEVDVQYPENFIKIALRYGCSPVNLLHIFRTPCPKNTSGWLLLVFQY